MLFIAVISIKLMGFSMTVVQESLIIIIQRIMQSLIGVEDLKKAITKKQHMATSVNKNLDPRLQYVGTNNKRPGPSLQPSLYEAKIKDERKAQISESKTKNSQGLNLQAATAAPLAKFGAKDIEQVFQLRCVGSEGVFVACDKELQSLVLKGCPDPVNKFFANTLFADLGVRCPNMRVLGRKENNEELRELLLGCDWALKEVATVKRTCKMCLTRAYVLLMEYIPSLNQTFVSQERSVHIFQVPKDNMNYNPILVQIGKMMAVDICFNNSDRIPTIWETSEGNPNNFLFKLKPNEEGKYDVQFDSVTDLNFEVECVVAIDNLVASINQKTAEEGYKLFVQRLDTFVSLLFSELTTQSKDYLCLNNVLSYFEKFFDYKFDWYQQRQILTGCLLCLISIAFEGQFCIEDAFNKTKGAVGGSEGTEWVDAAEKLDLGLFQQTSSMVTELINTNRQTICKILSKEKIVFYQEQVVGEKAKLFIADLWAQRESNYMEEIDPQGQSMRSSQKHEQEDDPDEVRIEDAGQLNSEQIQALRVQFDRFDTFSQGHIKKEDVEQMFKNIGQEVDMEEAMAILDPMTTGYVTFAALASYVGN